MTTLAQALALAQPALAKKPYVQHFTHYRCADESVIACDDRLGVRITNVQHGLNCCIPGTAFVNVFTDGAKIKQTDKSVTVECGSSTLKMPTLPAAEYPLLWPEPAADTPNLLLGPDAIKAISICMQGAGKDEDRPEFLGVTVMPFSSPGRDHLMASTDNVTITQCVVKVMEGHTDTMLLPFVLPDPFCRALINVCKHWEGSVLLWVSDSKVYASVGDNVEIFCSTTITTPWDCAGKMRELEASIGSAEGDVLPENWREGLQQLDGVLGNASHRGAEFRPAARGGFLASAERGQYSASIVMMCAADPPSVLRFDPKLLLRAPKQVTHLVFGPNFLHLSDDDCLTTYVVSASAALTKPSTYYEDDIPF